MVLKKYYLYLFLLLIYSGSTTMCMAQKEKKSQDPMSSISVYGISSSVIPDLELSAIKGDGESALKLSKHYDYALNDSKQASFWKLIGAENGNNISIYNTAIALLYNNKSDVRGVYWYRVAAKEGDIDAPKNLDLLGISYDFDAPADLFFQSMPKNLTFEQIKECEEGALKGNGVAALILAKFLRDITNDNDKAEYWFRIGAQNGNSECQYILGLILKSKPDSINQERGNFWLNRARSGDVR